MLSVGQSFIEISLSCVKLVCPRHTEMPYFDPLLSCQIFFWSVTGKIES